VCGQYALEEIDSTYVGRFVYGRSYLERVNAIPLDPVHLPLKDTEFETTKIDGMFGALRDTAPDAWGRMVIERRDRKRSFTELEYLLGASDARVGALSYGPEANEVPPESLGGVVAIDRLAQAAAFAHAFEGEIEGESSEILDQFAPMLDPSSALGGARPKTTLLDEDGQLWVAKFPSRGDRWSNAVSEAAWLSLAGECGIRVPETRVVALGRGSTLLVRRFDQEPAPGGSIRRTYLSAHTLLGLDEDVVRRSGWSYLELAHLIRRISDEPELDVRELFTRMVFNALVTNTDDHPRNHAVVGTAVGGWRLSPAYDLTPSTDGSLADRRLAMHCGLMPGRERWANRHNILTGAEHFGMSAEDARAEIDRVKDIVVARWQAHVLMHGGTHQDCRNVAHAVAYEGFEYE